MHTLEVVIEEVEWRAPQGGGAPEDLVVGLAELLVDAVESGASVSFTGGITLDEARQWWRKTLGSFGDRDVLLVARDATGIVGSVYVSGCWQPNQQFRGEVMKLLVHRRARRRGVANSLMEAIETRAREIGLTLLVLDTNAGSDADRLYRRRGWTRVGEIPDYSLQADGSKAASAFFYLKLT